MSEAKGSSSAATAGRAQKGTGFELRLEAAKAFVCLCDRDVAPGARIVELAMEVPEVRFPFDVGQGAGQFRLRLCDLARLEVVIGHDLLASLVARLDLAHAGIADLTLAVRSGFAEGNGHLEGGAPFTFKAGVLPSGEHGISVVIYDARLYAPAFLPAAALPAVLCRAAGGLAQQDGAVLEIEPLPILLRRTLPARGWKMPRTNASRLTSARLDTGELRFVWDRDHVGPADAPAEAELLAAVEGARAFRTAETLLAKNDWDAAREAYLAAGSSAAGHPFAAGRLLALLAMDERFYDEALDLAAEWRTRKPGFPPALAIEAVVRAERGENERAAAAFSELAVEAAKRGEEFSALAAAAACFAQGVTTDSGAMMRAVDVALGLRRDHLPALRALLALAEKNDDREALVRACRRLATYAPDEAEKARAHARLGEMLLVSDPPAARLHLDQALRLSPEDPEALGALARACEAAGEHLRAARAHDRLREIFAARGEREAAGRAALAVGKLWETRLRHPENALLRYREACELSVNSAEARESAARMADQLGHWTEAADHYSALLSSLDPGTPGAPEQAARAHRALAQIAQARLGDAARAASHLESVLAVEPHDTASLTGLAAIYRSLKRPAELLAVLDRLAPLATTPSERAALLAEAGGTALGSLSLNDAARTRFAAGLSLDPKCRTAIAGMVDLAVAEQNTHAEREWLERFLACARDRIEQAALCDRLAALCERTGDLASAVRVIAVARNAEPTLTRLAEAIRLARKTGGGTALAALLAEQAAAARAAGEIPMAAAAWLERARILAPNDLGLARAAVGEARTLLPGDLAALRLDADLAERAGDGLSALRSIEGLLATGPLDVGELEVRASRVALLAGDPQNARSHAEKAVAFDVEAAWPLLEEILDRMGDRTGRAELAERTGRWLDAARLWSQQGEEERGKVALERAVEDPASAERALEQLSDMSLGKGELRAAAAQLLSLSRLRKGREGARLAFRAAGLDPALEAEANEQAIANDAIYAPALAARAGRRMESDPVRALDDAETALAVQPEDPDALAPESNNALRKLAATAAIQTGQDEKARAHLVIYCQKIPDDDWALAELAKLHRRAGASTELAEVLSRRLERLTGPQATAIRVELAKLYAGPLARTGEAAQLVRAAVSDPSLSDESLRMLFSPALAGFLDSALRAELAPRLAAVAELPPAEISAALSERARMLIERNAPEDRAEVISLVREAVRLAPRNVVGLELLAQVAANEGQKAEMARALLARAQIAREQSEPDAGSRLVVAGQAALDADLAEDGINAFRCAVQLTLDRDEARTAWGALAADAVGNGDTLGERTALTALAPLLRTGEKPARLVRLSSLALAAGDLETARRSAEEARTLAPRDPAAVEACRVAAFQEGDLVAVAECLGQSAILEPERAGPLLLDRARILARSLSLWEEADRVYSIALSQLPPDTALATEHTRLRRRAPPPTGEQPWGEPLETYARRALDPHVSAVALRSAATLALAQGDSGSALRCARRAYARTLDEPAFIGPLLARILYLEGAFGEALVLHRALLDSGWKGIDESDVVVLCRQLAELAEDAEDRDLSLRALDILLELRPQDLEAANRRFQIDPDRSRAVNAISEIAEATRSARARTRMLVVAASAAQRELRDPALADALWGRSRVAAGDVPALLAAVEDARLDLVRSDTDVSSPSAPLELIDALENGSAAWQAAGELSRARSLLEEAADLQSRHGRFKEAAQELERLEILAVQESDPVRACGYAREAALLLLDQAGDSDRAERALKRAVSHDRRDRESWRLIQVIARSRGADGSGLLEEALAVEAEIAPDPQARAEALVALASIQEGPLANPERAARSLEGALEAVPDHVGARELLVRVYRTLGRAGPLARLLLGQAVEIDDRASRAALRSEAAALLERLADEESLSLAADAYAAAAGDAPHDLALSRAAGRLLLALDRREEAIPHLAALVRADPDDEASARELAKAYAGRHRERAELFLSRAGRAEGEAKAARLREAAKALFAAGEDVRARGLLRDAFDAWPADDQAFLTAIRDAASDIERLDAVLAARAHAIPADAAGCHRARADALLAFGRVAAAEKAYEACLSIAPEDAGALSMLAECRAEHHGDDAAANADERLCALADHAPGVVESALEARSRYRLGLSAWGRGRPVDGIVHLERALALAPDDPRAGLAWTALASGHAMQGNGSQALASLRRRADRAARLQLSSERREALEAGAGLATQLDDQGSDAAALLEGLVTLRLSSGGELDAPFDQLLDRAFQALVHCGESARAEQMIVLAAQASEGARRAALLLRLARAAEERGDHEAARTARAEAEVASPASVRSSAPGLDELKASGDLSGYARALEEALASPDDRTAELTLELARTRSELGDSSGAAEAHATILEMGPTTQGFAEACSALASHYEKTGNARALAAVHTYRAEASTTPTEQIAAYLAAAAVLEQDGAPPSEVRAALDLACGSDPDEPAPWEARAAFESRNGDPLAAARAHLAAAIRTEGDRAADSALEGARLFESLSRPEDAARAYTAAVHAKPDCVPARGALARRALARGDSGAAAEHLAAISEVGAPPPTAPSEEAARVESEPVTEKPLAIEPTPGQPQEAEASTPGEGSSPTEHEAAGSFAELEVQAKESPEAVQEKTEQFLEPAVDDWNFASTSTKPDSAPEPFAQWPEDLIRAADIELEPDFAPPEAEAVRAVAAPILDADVPSEGAQEESVEAAYARLKAARRATPDDLSVAHDLASAAEKLGRLEEAVQLGELCADGLAEHDPGAAVVRYRQCAELLRDRLSDPDAATALLEKALSLTPDDPEIGRELWALHALRNETAPRALEAYLRLARQSPADGVALAAIGSICARLADGEGDAGLAWRLRERGRVAESLANLVSTGFPVPKAATPAKKISPEVRAKAAPSGSLGPLVSLVSLLTPYLEPLFPANLTRRGVGPQDRVGTGRAPSLHERLGKAEQVLGSRAHVAFLSQSASCEIAVENTQPLSLVVGVGAIAALAPAALSFLLARALTLLDYGWALVGKFAPRDVGILCELACRFAGGSPPALGLPSERAEAFLAALERTVPPDVRAEATRLAGDATRELETFDGRVFADSLRSIANRTALLYTGEPRGALEALARLDRSFGGADPETIGPAELLAAEGLRDIAVFALSDLYLDLRAAVTA